MNPSQRSRRQLLVGAFGAAGLLALTSALSCSCEGPQPESEGVTLYIVRHAEKAVFADDAPAELRKDPPLSDAGKLRALSLTEDLPVQEIRAIYVTKTKRSKDTASAVAAVTGKEPLYYDPKNVDKTIEQLRHYHGGALLLVGHSNTIPPLLEALGVPGAETIADDQYGDLWVVQAMPDGSASVERRHYGGSAEPFDPGK